MKIMALDYGSVTVGVAMTDALGLTAQPAETITRESETHLRKTLRRIEELVTANDVEKIILGKPVHLDGSEGERVEKCTHFKELLQNRVDVPILWQDERLTTVEADEILEEMGIPRSERKKHIDAIAAAIILRQYMNEEERKERLTDHNGE